MSERGYICQTLSPLCQPQSLISLAGAYQHLLRHVGPNLALKELGYCLWHVRTTSEYPKLCDF